MLRVNEPLSDLERKDVREKARGAVVTSLVALGGRATRADLLEHATAHGGFTQRELDAPPPPRASAQYDRLVPYQLSWALSDLKRVGKLVNPERSVWGLAGVAAASAPPPSSVAGADEARLTELRTMPYRRYLRTSEWRRTRAAALARPSAMARRKAKREAELRDLVLRLCLAAGLIVGLLGMLGR